MPSPIVIQDLSGLGEGITQFGSALGQALQQRGENLRKQKIQQNDETILNTVISGMEQGQDFSPVQLYKYGSQIKDPENRKLFQTMFEPQLKEEAKVRAYENYKKRKKEPSQDDQSIGLDAAETTQKNKNVAYPDDPIVGKVTYDEIMTKLDSPFPQEREEGKAMLNRIENLDKINMKDKNERLAENRKRTYEYGQKNYSDEGLGKKIGKINAAIKLVKSKKVSMDDNFGRNLISAYLEGKGQDAIAEMIKTPEQQQLNNLLRDLITPKEFGGSNPSTREFMYALLTSASQYKSEAANLFILNGLKKEYEVAREKQDYYNRLLEENPDISMATLSRQISKFEGRLREDLDEKYQKEFIDDMVKDAKQEIKNIPAAPGTRWILVPTTGERFQVPEEQLDEALENDGILL